MSAGKLESGTGTDRRRSQRVHVRVAIAVSGEGPGKKSFAEETQTLVVNAHGALILLGAAVAAGQSLTVSNMRTREELFAKVIHVGYGQEGKTTVAIEFTQPAPRFWQIAFPPPDWTPENS